MTFYPAEHTFSVDHSSKMDDAVTAVKELRRMIRYGKLAEQALQSIMKTGFHNGQTPCARKYIEFGSASIVHHRFRELVVPTREHLCPMSELRVTLGDKPVSNYGPVFVPVIMSGPMKVQWDHGQVETRHRKVTIGNVRLNKGTPTFSKAAEAPGVPGINGVFKIYKDGKSAKAHDTIDAIARSAAIFLMRAAYDCDEIVPRQKTRSFDHRASLPKKDQLTQDIGIAAAYWLVQDGHAERFMEEIWCAIPVIQVMLA